MRLIRLTLSWQHLLHCQGIPKLLVWGPVWESRIPSQERCPLTTTSYQTTRRKSRANWPFSLLGHLGREEAEDFRGNKRSAWDYP